ncbi:unnamed protein product [Caretta caretta]
MQRAQFLMLTAPSNTLISLMLEESKAKLLELPDLRTPPGGMLSAEVVRGKGELALGCRSWIKVKSVLDICYILFRMFTPIILHFDEPRSEEIHKSKKLASDQNQEKIP